MSLQHLLSPQSIAVVGASKDPAKIGAQILANLIKSEYPGQLYPVNHKETTLIQGLQPYSSLTQIPDSIDLAIIVIPASFVAGIVDQAIAKQVKSLIIISAGFKEIDQEGARLEASIARKCAQANITLLGPNCLGLIIPSLNLNASFAHHAPQPGNIAFLSQSGAFGTAAIDWADHHNLGFSLFVSLGNKAGVSENDFLNSTTLNQQFGHNPHFVNAFAAGGKAVRATTRETKTNSTSAKNNNQTSPMHLQNADYVRTDSLTNTPENLQKLPKRSSTDTNHTNVLALYLENFQNGYEFIRKAHELVKTTPIIMLKPGKSAQAKTAMQSHTGSLASDDSIITAACAKAGIIRADTSEDLFHYIHAFSRAKPLHGNRIAIITNAGGPGILATDHLPEHGLTLAPISAKGQKELATLLPRAANIHDPVDVLGDAKADRYFHALKVCVNEPEVDGILVILTPQTSTEIEKTARIITQIQSITDKPIMASFLGGTLVKEGITHLTSHHIASFYYPEQAIQAFGAMHLYQTYQARNTLAPISVNFNSGLNTSHQTQSSNSQILDLTASSQLLIQAGIHTAEFQTVDSHAATEKAFSELATSNPVVMKLLAPDLLHKTELHAVLTNITTVEAATSAFRHLQSVQTKHQIPNSQIIIQKQFKGLEAFLGMKRDPQFGPVILFGLGGIYTEIFNDVARGIAPLTRNEALDMIQSTSIGKILAGARGREPFDLHHIAVILCQFAGLCQANPQIKEIDINPIIITDDDAIWAADVKILT